MWPKVTLVDNLNCSSSCGPPGQTNSYSAGGRLAGLARTDPGQCQQHGATRAVSFGCNVAIRELREE